MYQRSAQQCFEDAARCFKEAGLAALRMEIAGSAGASVSTVQIVEEIAAARLEGYPQALEAEEEGYEEEEPPEPEEPPRQRRRLERPQTPPRQRRREGPVE
eukprot:1746457-Alexandrium_andersonii.AAC.1